MKKQNGLSRSADTCAKRKVKRSQLGGAKQVGAAGKKAVPAVKKHSAFGGSIIQAGRQAGEGLCADAQRLWKKITGRSSEAEERYLEAIAAKGRQVLRQCHCGGSGSDCGGGHSLFRHFAAEGI